MKPRSHSGVVKRQSKPHQRATLRPDITRLQPQRIAFRLKGDDGHTIYRDCFLDHLSDAVKLSHYRKWCTNELKDVQRAVADEVYSITARTAYSRQLKQRPELHTYPQADIDMEKEIEIKMKRQQRALDDERVTESDLREINRVLKKVLDALYSSMEPYCHEVMTRKRGCPIALPKKSVKDIHFLRACEELVRAEEEKYQESRAALYHSPRDPTTEREREAQRLALKQRRKQLDVMRDEHTDRETTTLEKLLPILGDLAQPVYFCTEGNIAELQFEIGENDIANSGNANASRSNEDRSDDLSGWTESIHEGAYIDTTGNDPFNERHSLAETIRDAQQKANEARTRLRELQRQNFEGLLTWIFGCHLCSPSDYEKLRNQRDRARKQPIFKDVEAKAMKDLEVAERELQNARKAMRDDIGQRPMPSESSFGDRTSDYNVEDAPMIKEKYALSMPTDKVVVPWVRKVVREAGDERNDRAGLPPAQVDPITGIRTIDTEENESNGNGTEHSVKPRNRKQDWIQKAKARGFPVDEVSAEFPACSECIQQICDGSELGSVIE